VFEPFELGTIENGVGAADAFTDEFERDPAAKEKFWKEPAKIKELLERLRTPRRTYEWSTTRAIMRPARLLKPPA